MGDALSLCFTSSASVGLVFILNDEITAFIRRKSALIKALSRCFILILGGLIWKHPSLLPLEVNKGCFLKVSRLFHGGKKKKKRRTSSHYGNEAPYLFFTSAKLVFHHLSFERRLQFGLLMSFWFLCQSNKPLSGAQVLLRAQLGIITSISLSQSERRQTRVSQPPLSLAGAEM